MKNRLWFSQPLRPAIRLTFCLMAGMIIAPAGVLAEQVLALRVPGLGAPRHLVIMKMS